MTVGVAVVTGATRGLGRAVTAALVGLDHEVVAIARDAAALELLTDLPGPGSVRPLVADLGERGDLDRVAETLAALEGAPLVLVNNAARQVFDPVDDLGTDEFAATLAVNTLAPYALCRAVLPAMRAGGGGLIINVASDLAYRPLQGGAAYCASKAALVAWSQVLQEEQRQHGIKVTVVEPGWIATGSSAQSRAERGDMDPDALAESIVALLGLPAALRVDRLVVHPMNQGTWG